MSRSMKIKEATEEYCKNENSSHLLQIINATKSELIKQYGFVADDTLSLKANIRYQILHRPYAYLSNHKVTNMAFHNLCIKSKVPSNAKRLLGLGSKFCLENRMPKYDHVGTFSILSRTVRLKCYFEELTKNRILNTDGDENVNNDFNPRLYVKSKINPPLATFEVEDQLYKFRDLVTELHTSLPKIPNYNIDKVQRQVLNSIRNDPNIITLNSDKNLGLVTMDRTEYIKAMMSQHCLDGSNYALLTPEQAHFEMREASFKIRSIVDKYAEDIDPNDYVYFQRSFPVNKRIPQLYGTPKLFKEKDVNGFYRMRPILSKCGSQPEIASRWIDVKLQKLTIQTRLKDSFEFLYLIEKTKLEPYTPARLVSADAESMYSNMDIQDTIDTVEKYLREIAPAEELNFDLNLLIELLDVVLNSNIFMIGNLFFKKISGIPMGTVCAVIVSNIYVGYREETFILKKYKDNFSVYKRYLDDVFTLWTDGVNGLTIDDLEHDLHQCKLPWKVTKPATKLVFLNVTVHLDVKSGKLSTVSFQKAQNLHSYLPSYSAHSQDCLRGMIFGFVRRYWLQNTNPEDYSYMIKLFAKRLTARGHSLPTVNKIITEAVSSLEIQMPNRKIFINNNKRSSNTGINENLFYHAEYHPLGVKRELIQKAFKATLNKLGLYNKMTVCYNLPTNLRDLLMSSKLPNVPGCNPSDFLNSFKK